MQGSKFNFSRQFGDWQNHVEVLAKYMKTIVIALAVFSISACGSSGNGDNSEANTNTDTSANADANGDGGTAAGGQSSSALSGVWFQCLGGFNLGSTYTFTATNWEETQTFFEDETCSVPSPDGSGLNFGGTYSIVGTGVSDGGLDVLLIDFNSETLDGTPLLAGARITRHSIVFTGTANELRFGVLADSEEARPTQLDFDIPPYMLR